MSNGFCVNYCLVISIAALILLSYLGLLCLFDSKELRIEHKHNHVSTLFVAAAIYLFILVVMIGIKCRKRQIVVPQGYQALDDAT